MGKLCAHKNETPYITFTKNYCKDCSKIYYIDDKPINWKIAARGKLCTIKENIL